MAEPAPPRVLVVDDEAGMRKSLAIMLRREDYTVAEAAGGCLSQHIQPSRGDDADAEGDITRIY